MQRQRLLFAARLCAWLVLGAFLVLLARKLDWDQVFGAFHGVDLWLGLAAAIIAALPILCQGLRWSALVREVANVSRRLPVAALAVGQAASAFLPMRAGEAVRTELLARRAGLSRATAIGTVALDHSVNGLVMFAFAGLLPLLLPVPRWMALVLWGGMLVAIAFVAALIWLARHPGLVSEGRIARLAMRARDGLSAAHNPRAVAEAFAFSALGWAVEIVVAMFALAAFHLPHDVPHAMAVLFGVNLALAIPSPPAALGNFELGAGSALVAFGGDPSRAAAFAMGYHAIQLLPTLMLGGIMLTQLKAPRLAHA